MPNEVFGKYRATVLDNDDPTGRLRLQVQIPDVLTGGVWAEACLPVAGTFAIAPVLPAPGTSVWIEFEGGDPNLPVWTGRIVGAGNEPNDPALSLVIAADGQIELVFRDGCVIQVDAGGMSLSNGRGASIRMTGPTVSINNDALTVT